MRLVMAIMVAALLAGCANPTPMPHEPTEPAYFAGRGVGDWWTIAITDETSGATTQVTYVVSADTDVGPLIGTAGQTFDPIVLLLPAAPIGAVGHDLSWTFGGEVFAPLAFPLVVGKTWKTSLQGGELDAEVMAIEGDLARIELHGTLNDVYLTYDTSIGIIVDYLNDGWVSTALLEHGLGFKGTANIPVEYSHPINVGRALGAVSPGGIDPSMSDQVTVDSTWQNLAVMSTAGALQAPDPIHDQRLPGIARERIETPAGEVFDTIGMPNQGLQVDVRLFDEPAGQWLFEHIAGGGAAAVSFGAAYNLTPANLE